MPKKGKNVETVVEEEEQANKKRGRKSKKELLESLNIASFITPLPESKSNVALSLIEDGERCKQKQDISNSVNEIVDANEIVDTNKNENAIVNTKDAIIENNNDSIHLNIVEIDRHFTNANINANANANANANEDEDKVATKKRGRKPKGGKIIQQLDNNLQKEDERPNVILHLKCSLKDLQTNVENNEFMESYHFLNGKNGLNYELIGNNNNNDKTETCYECDDYEEESVCKDATKEIWKKLKQLEHNLHINNVSNRKSACFWDTCEFDNPPIYIPKHFINGTHHVYGCFCSPECGVAYLMNENLDSSTKFERYHLFNHIYAKIYDYKQNIKPAPNPYYMLEKYYGNLSIQEYRSLLKNERLFLIVDKPLTRILPELHEDNDDFILNNKIIPSNNNYQVKSRLQRKKTTKTNVIHEKFGTTATTNHFLLE
jgi:hypothetical protein